MRILICITLLLFSTITYGAHEFDVTALGSVSGGNHDSIDLGTNLRFQINNFEAKALANYQNTSNKIFAKYLGDIRYEHSINPVWSVFADILVERDTKQKVDLKTMEIAGVLYNFASTLDYSLGVGHRLENDVNSIIIAHRLKWEEVIGRFEPIVMTSVHHSFDDYEIESEVGLRVRPIETFRFGILGAHSYDSLPVLGVKRVDYSVRAEFTFNLFHAG